MTSTEAIELLEPAVGSAAEPAAGIAGAPAARPGPVAWLDLGAGSGTFTEALAHLLGPGATVLAVDNDPAAVDRLRARTQRLPAGTASVAIERGDIAALSSVAAIDGAQYDGALLANVLHFFPKPAAVLRDVALRLAAGGRIVVIEYDGVARNRWVPYPIPASRLGSVARAAGFEGARIVAGRRSRFGGELYCAVLADRRQGRS